MKHFLRTKILVLSLSLICILFAQSDQLFSDKYMHIVKLDTLGYENIYLPQSLKADFPFHITSSRAIKDAYKIAQEKHDGYMIYMLSILEFENVFTYGNLIPGKMLFEAFNIAKSNDDARLAVFVLAQQMRYNLFTFWYPVDFVRHAADIAITAQDPSALFEIANIAEIMKYSDPNPRKLRALAYGFTDPITIHQDEFDVYWNDLKTCIKNSDKQVFDLYVAPSVTYQQADFGDIYNERDYTRAELEKDLEKRAGGPGLLPVWSEPMDSVAVGKPIQHRRGEYTIYYWTLGREYNNPDQEFIYKSGKSGPVSYETVYYFKKIDGKIRLYKIFYEDM